MPDAKISSFQLPAGETVEVILVRLPGGKLVVRSPRELLQRPTPPAPSPGAKA
jgi:hypothetical protein